VAPSEIGKMELELEASTAATRIGAELNGDRRPGRCVRAPSSRAASERYLREARL
jgi:hypothetical protein